mgnify:CR=1 FL=1
MHRRIRGRRDQEGCPVGGGRHGASPQGGTGGVSRHQGDGPAGRTDRQRPHELIGAKTCFAGHREITARDLERSGGQQTGEGCVDEAEADRAAVDDRVTRVGAGEARRKRQRTRADLGDGHVRRSVGSDRARKTRGRVIPTNGYDSGAASVSHIARPRDRTPSHRSRLSLEDRPRVDSDGRTDWDTRRSVGDEATRLDPSRTRIGRVRVHLRYSSAVLDEAAGGSDGTCKDGRPTSDARAVQRDIRSHGPHGAQRQRAAAGVVGNGEVIVELDVGGNRVQAG